MSFDHGYALLIGVGTYAHHPELNVPVTVRDAQAVQDALQDPARCGYLPEQVKLLHDASANRVEILAQLEHLAQQEETENTVTIFYCGHGAYGTDGSYYLTTHDTRTQGDKVVAGSGVSEADLLAGLHNIKARRLLLWFNACHSGEVSPSLGPDTSQPFGALSLPSSTAEALLSSGEGRILITACRPEQSSLIGPGPLTCFTQALVDGLSGRGSVVNNQGYISVFSLYEHTYRAVKEAAGKLGRLQEPELTVLKGVGPFPVALYRGASDLGAFNADETLPPDTAIQQVEAAVSKYRFQQYIRNVTAIGGGVEIGSSVQRSVINTGTVNGPLYNIQGGIHAKRDVVMGDQTKIAYSPPQPQTSAEFIEELKVLKAQISKFKRLPDLNAAQKINLQVAEQKVSEAVSHAQKPQPRGKNIQTTLTEAKEIMELLSGTLQGAVTMGTAISMLTLKAIKLFGE